MNREEEERGYDTVELAEQIREDEERETRQQDAEREEEEDRERREELTAHLTQQIRRTPVTDMPTIQAEPIRLHGGEVVRAINHGDIAPVTMNIATDNAWTATLQRPRRYQFNFHKVNSIEDIAKVLEALQKTMNFNMNQQTVDELGIKDLVKRVDDINYF